MYPRLLIDIEKLKHNIDVLGALAGKAGCSLSIVTKSICADDRACDMIASHPAVSYMADSRISNIKKYHEKAHAAGKQTLLLRLPMMCEIEDVVKYADISFNSEVSTIKALNEEAGRQGVIHRVVLMVDLGDLREGIFFRDLSFEDKKHCCRKASGPDAVLNAARLVQDSENLELYGISTNLTCYGAIIPKHDNLSVLCEIAECIENELGVKLQMISGGNSSSVYLVDKNELPEKINNLRPGEGYLLGNETAYGKRIEGTFDDALMIEAQIIELKRKPSVPIGEVGMDAFGNRPEFEEHGIITRAILGIGEQDMDVTGMIPVDKKIRVLGASSDHMILDVTEAEQHFHVGDTVRFKLKFGAMLKAATSTYVEKYYL